MPQDDGHFTLISDWKLRIGPVTFQSYRDPWDSSILGLCYISWAISVLSWDDWFKVVH